MTFNSSSTAAYNARSTAQNTATGQVYASYVLGAVNSGSFTLSAVLETGARFRRISPYVQDNWQITPNLTLDTGVRYDYYPSSREVKDRLRTSLPVTRTALWAIPATRRRRLT